MPRPRELPPRARVVIIGGGVGGAAIAHWLAQLGERDVVLVDRAELTSGSTFHSAGLVGQLRSSLTLTRMMMDSVALYRELDCGWVECGGIRLACTPEREQEVLRQVAWAKTFGLPLEVISPAEAVQRFPLMVPDEVRCGSYLGTDGYLDPSLLTTALVDSARAGGCRVFTHTRVTGIDVRDGRVRGVHTEWGDVDAEIVVNAGGMFAAEIGRMAGVRVPIVPFAHEYLVTQPFRERTPGEHLPTLRDPDLLIYFREEGAGLVMGGYERQSAPWSLDAAGVDRIPADFNGRLLEEDWPRFEEIARNSARRVPAMAEEITVTRLINGPEAFTPDNEFCLGESEVAGFFVAAGFCAHGLAGAGGMGRLMAEWILSGEPQHDVWEMDIRRFGAQYRSPRYTLARAREVYETYYDIRYPGHERQAGRPLRVSSAYEWHRAHGAAFGEKSGWERVNWYSSNAADGDESLRPRGWAGMHWSPAIGAEHVATREAAGLFDESSFAKLEVSGPGAAELLTRLCDNNVVRDVGAITYTQMLNARGGIESDFTVTRLGEDEFGIVTGTAFGNHDLAWIRRHLPDDGSVRVADVTSRWACFALWGPRSGAILSSLTPDPLDFGYMRMREIAVGDVPVRALRVTFVGELGWELYCPVEYGAGLWRSLWEAGGPHGLRAGGYRAIDSLRLEKGYRVWAADITAEDTPLEAGLRFAVREGGGFVGAEALAAAPLTRRLRCLVLDDPRSVALGNEPVRVGGAVVGRVTSGGYGYTVARSIAYAYLPAGVQVGERVEVDVFGEWIGGAVVAEPLFDPAGERVRAAPVPARR
ncbi:MAG TPA: FAD-dependent oxidoreductase [Solirubrobacteraceae bacterium]|nr:FAD-dependent oxidoreductase [Solirubrobacteraceae bacterium]